MRRSLETSHWTAEAAAESCEPTTIGGALIEASSRWADSVALVEGTGASGARSWTYAELAAVARRVAGALLSRFQPGDHVGVWSTNNPEWVFLQFGCALAGMTLVTVNPAYGRAEAEYVLKHSRARGVFVEPTVRSRDLVGIARAVASTIDGPLSVIPLDDWDRFLALAPDEPLDLPPVRLSDPAQIQYTSGTTGKPKGALLAHRGLALNGKLYATAVGAGPGDVWINPMPLFHTAGCGLATMGALQTGGTHVLPPRFDPDLVLDLFEQHRGTVFLSVPTMLIRLLDAQRGRPRDLVTWRLATLGGAPVPVELVRRAERELRVRVGIGYGQTESSPYIAHTRPGDPRPGWEETVGRPLPLVEVKIDDPVTGEPTALGRPGEICTRGACVMLGYVDDPGASAQAIDADGWLHTGDIGTLDADGYLRVEGRLKDMIIRGGENIYPREIEELLFRHEAVAQVSVVGLPDEEWGEVVAAFVQLTPGCTTDASSLERYCRRHLAGFKVPRHWEFVAEFPHTPSGKIQKFALRDRFLRSRRPASVPRRRATTPDQEGTPDGAEDRTARRE
ncbi:AMP-binding protein [Streptomyces sp. NPDC026672]|uniref:AMP-binding protein n=1 Tax=unclassified Streptomyces TaxID=2593676 RepID=UPI0033E06648